MRREWWLEPNEPEQPICPECGQECEVIYTRDGSPVGCDNCIYEMDAYDWWQEEKESRQAEKGSYYHD